MTSKDVGSTDRQYVGGDWRMMDWQTDGRDHAGDGTRRWDGRGGVEWGVEPSTTTGGSDWGR